MSIDRLIGRTYLNDMDAFAVEFHYLSETAARLRVVDGRAVCETGHTEEVALKLIEIRDNVFFNSWREQNGSTVTRIDDHDANLIYASITMPHGQLYVLKGRLSECARPTVGQPSR